MKKIFLSLAVASTVLAANAQDLMSKRGMPILPEVGDWSIGIDATPFIDWAMDKTRVFSNTTVTSVGTAVNSQTPFTLVGMMVKDATTTYRAKVRIGFGSRTNDMVVNLDGGAAGATVTDEQKQTGTAITLGVGIQKNRGKGRLRGIYGAEVGFGIVSGDATYSYGNAFTATNQTPTTSNFGNNVISANSRVTENKAGSTFNLNLDGFIGVEYFFAPKMSFSAEYNWGLFISSTGAGSQSVETGNGTASTITSRDTGKNSNTNVDVNNINSSNSGNIIFHFYF